MAQPANDMGDELQFANQTGFRPPVYLARRNPAIAIADDS